MDPRPARSPRSVPSDSRSRRPGSLATTSVPDSLEAGRINLYRWSWVLAFVVWWAAGWLVARALVRWAPVVVPPARRAAPFLGVGAIVAVLVASLAATGPDDARRDAQAFDVDRQLGDTVDDRFGDEGPVMVVDDGTAANLSTAPALIARLVDEGTAVQLPPRRIDSYGSDRAFDPETVGSVLLVASRFGALDGVPGQPVEEYRLTPETAPIVDRLVEAARSAPVRRSAEADDLLAELYPPVGAPRRPARREPRDQPLGGADLTDGAPAPPRRLPRRRPPSTEATSRRCSTPPPSSGPSGPTIASPCTSSPSTSSAPFDPSSSTGLERDGHMVRMTPCPTCAFVPPLVLVPGHAAGGFETGESKRWDDDGS